MISKADTLRVLETMLELPPHRLTGSERLADLDGWDSLSTLLFIAQVDQMLGLPLPGARVAAAKTVDDLCAVVGAAATNRAA